MTGWRRRWQRYRRQNRFLVGMYLTLLLLSSGGFLLFYRMRDLPPEQLTNRLLTFLLWWFDLTLIAILLFILLRNFVKLLLERRQGVLGSRFRTKLLLSYLVVILIPTVMLSLLSALLLSRAATTWFSEPVEDMARAGVELADEVRRETESRLERAAAVMATSLGSRPEGSRRIAELEALHGAMGYHLSGLWRAGRAVVEFVDPRQPLLQRLPSLGEEQLRSAGVRGERFGGTLVVRAWHPVSAVETVVVGEALPEQLVASQATLAQAGAAYQQLKLDRPTITATVVLGFGGSALVVSFGAIWLGLYLSRRFTEPLLALVATTERSAAGETLEEVPTPAEDEVGLLVASFNAMVRRLREQDAELRAAIHRLDTVLGAVRTGVLTLDASRSRIVGNPAAAALLALPELQEGVHPVGLLVDAGLGRLAELIGSASKAERTTLTLHPGGGTRIVEVAVVPLGSDEQTQGWVVALEDLTQLLRAQRQAAWSEVARRIAHQIKNPLTPIRLAAERIARHVERQSPNLDQVVPQGCTAIVEHVEALKGMVDAFARYAKMPATSRRSVGVENLVRQVVALYEGLRPGLQVHLASRVDDWHVMADPGQLRQVLTNLLDNAVEASPPEGRIVVELEREDDELVVTVSDQGSGLQQEDSDLLFQPFFSTKGRGSGVGLAIVHRIVTDHGGSIRLLPNDPCGVKAVVRIPGGDA